MIIEKNDKYYQFWCVLNRYELDNQQIFSEASELRTYENNQQAIYKSGAYSFVGSDGQTYWVTYYADDKGFHPTIGKLNRHLMSLEAVENNAFFQRVIEYTEPNGISCFFLIE